MTTIAFKECITLAFLKQKNPSQKGSIWSHCRKLDHMNSSWVRFWNTCESESHILPFELFVSKLRFCLVTSQKSYSDSRMLLQYLNDSLHSPDNDNDNDNGSNKDNPETGIWHSGLNLKLKPAWLDQEATKK